MSTVEAAAGKAQAMVRDSVKTVIAASMVGTAIEFYDFYAYGTAAANYFPKVFFGDTTNPTVALLASLLTNLSSGDVLFIDEIHRLPRIVEEVLYSAMEDFMLSIVVSREQGAKTLNIPLEAFTLVGATTRVGDLSSPLRARFGITEKLNFYTLEEIEQIVLRTARVYQTTIDADAAHEIALRSRGTPRIANRLFRRVRDFANYENRTHVTLEEAKKALEALKVDSLGLDDVDIRYLEGIMDRFHGGPVGLEALASAIGEEVVTLELSLIHISEPTRH